MPTKEGKLTYDEMVAIINRNESVIVNGERVSTLAELPTPAAVAVGLDPQAIEDTDAKLEAQIKALEEQRAELKKASAEAKKANAELEKGEKEAEKSAEEAAKENAAESKRELKARHDAQVEADKAAAEVEAERIDGLTK